MDIGNVIAAVVVLAVLGAVFGFILAVASKVFEVKKDPREVRSSCAVFGGSAALQTRRTACG